jgi:hypothetical protein
MKNIFIEHPIARASAIPCELRLSLTPSFHPESFRGSKVYRPLTGAFNGFNRFPFSGRVGSFSPSSPSVGFFRPFSLKTPILTVNNAN